MAEAVADPTIKSLYIGDLQDWMDENYIFRLLSPSGEIVNVKIIRNKVTGASEGYGFIECVSHDAAGRVLEVYNGQPIHDTGAMFRLNWATHGQGKRAPSEDWSLFVGDLAGEVTEAMLLDHFRSYFPNATNARVIMDVATGRSKGYGFVRFMTEQERDQAIGQMNGTFLSSKTIRVCEATSKKQSSTQSAASQQYGSDLTNTTLFIGNLSPSITEDFLKGTFSQFGEIIYVKIPAGRNCGFVQYVDRLSAEAALGSMNNRFIGDCTIRVSWGRNRSTTTPAATTMGTSASMAAVPPPYQYPGGYVTPYDPNVMAAYGYDPNAYAAYYGAYGAYAAAYAHAPAGYVEAERPENTEYDPRAPDDVHKMNQQYIETNQPPLNGSSLRVP